MADTIGDSRTSDGLRFVERLNPGSTFVDLEILDDAAPLLIRFVTVKRIFIPVPLISFSDDVTGKGVPSVVSDAGSGYASIFYSNNAYY